MKKKKYKYNLENFNHRNWLDSIQYNYYTKGSNVGKGWIGLDCPFCPDGDTGGHLGINEKTKAINCWRCHTKGNILKLIEQLQGKTAVFKVLKHFMNGNIRLTALQDHMQAIRGVNCTLPKRATPTILPPHSTYLKNRNFNPEYLYKKYKLQSIGICPDWGYRIVIPIYYGNKLGTFIGRDITDKAKIRYKACPLDQSIIDPKGGVYNLNSAKNRLILVEGVTDAWRIGDGCGAILGTELDNRQIVDIANSKVKEVFILFDNDKAGQTATKTWANALSGFVSVHIIELTGYEDPGQLPTNEVEILRKDIFGKIF